MCVKYRINATASWFCLISYTPGAQLHKVYNCVVNKRTMAQYDSNEYEPMELAIGNIQRIDLFQLTSQSLPTFTIKVCCQRG